MYVFDTSIDTSYKLCTQNIKIYAKTQLYRIFKYTLLNVAAFFYAPTLSSNHLLDTFVRQIVCDTHTLSLSSIGQTVVKWMKSHRGWFVINLHDDGDNLEHINILNQFKWWPWWWCCSGCCCWLCYLNSLWVVSYFLKMNRLSNANKNSLSSYFKHKISNYLRKSNVYTHIPEFKKYFEKMTWWNTK